MSFVAHHYSRWTRGATLVGTSDSIPDDALRRATNVRLDRTLGVIEARPGWTLLSNNIFASAVIWLSKLYAGAAGIYSYVQYGTLLTRASDTTWNAVVNFTVGSDYLTDVNSPDGNGNFLKYFVNQGNATKDSGTLNTTMGIVPPSAAPLTAELATDLYTQIDDFEVGDAANWTGSSLASGPSDDAATYQQGTASMTFAIAASTFGSVSRYMGAAIDLDTLVGGDALVKNDDYIFLWVRCTTPQNLTYVQLDIDVDSATTGVGDAFRRNYYSFKGSALTRVSGGTSEWTKLQVRKSEFTRYGTDPAVSFATARTFRIGFLTNNAGGVTINVDDFKLRGGIGLEGTISYTACYRNSVTMARGNPPKDSDGVVLYTTPLLVDRQQVSVAINNITSPADTQIDTMLIFRKGGIFTTAVLVDSIADNAASPYVDTTSDATLVLTNILLELDNDIPPTATTSRIIFGPDGSGHYFIIVDGYKLYISKPYERLENRVENWPALGFALIGDGSTKAIAGLATSTQIRVWSTAMSYNVVGVGQDTFVPVALDGTRGCVGRYAVTSGDGVIFFVSQDGIYEDINGQQRKLTGAIDKFFQGITVDGQYGWNSDSVYLADVRLAFLHEPTGSALVMTYIEGGGSGARKHITMKPNLQDGRLTEAFFDYSNVTSVRSLFLDTLRRQLVAGMTDGNVYQIEDSTSYTDAGPAIPILVREKSYNMGQPERGKYISHTEVEGNTTSQNLTVTAYYNRAATSEVLSTVFNTSTDTSVQQFPTASPTTARRDIALEISGNVQARVMISRMGRYCEPQPEALTFWDSGIVDFEFIQQLKRLQLDLLSSVSATLKIFLNGSTTAIYTGTVSATTVRTSNPFYLTAGIQASSFRITILSSTAATFIPYKFSGFFKPLGVDQDYVERVLLQGI